MRLRAGIAAAHSAGRSRACHLLSIATGTEGCNRIWFATLPRARLGQQWSYVRLIGGLKDAICSQDITGLLGTAQSLVVHQQRFGIGCLNVEDALDHRLDLRLDVVRLVDHVGDATGVGVAFGARADDLIEYTEEIEGILRTDDQVVI